MDKYTVLQQYFGHSSFRPGQEELVDALLAGRDALGVMPTGAGKSVCYQVPALLRKGMTIVISPLISLMADQVSALKEAGIPAACIHSALEPAQVQEVFARAERGELRILYVAPERLETGRFAALCRRVPIPLVAVDEAHCVSQWGQDFRPSYLQIAPFLASLPRRPAVGAFTATATAQVREDMIRLLALQNPAVLTTGYDRPNLFFEVLAPKRKNDALLSLVRARRGQSGIVYCSTRANVEKVCALLNENGIPAARYHAGLPDEERQANQEDFLYDRKPVMAATNAFGMGIDKSNVSFVIHYNMPKDLESYYQEAGRAGRDGEPASCILLYSAGDVQTARFLIRNAGENDRLSPEEREELLRRDLARLDRMTGYCRTAGCLRQYILRYFGQGQDSPCGNCGNCRSEYELLDITVPAQKILSCVVRTERLLGYSVGAALYGRILSGSKDQRIFSLGLDRLPTYGLLREEGRGFVRECIGALAEQGFLLIDEKKYHVLRLTPAARKVLFEGKQVFLRVKKEREPAPAAPALPASPDAGLFSALKALRTRLAQQARVPAYIIFSNAALSDMAAKKPRSMAEFLRVSGVGAVKAERYGEEFLACIREYGAGAD